MSGENGPPQYAFAVFAAGVGEDGEEAMVNEVRNEEEEGLFDSGNEADTRWVKYCLRCTMFVSVRCDW